MKRLNLVKRKELREEWMIFRKTVLARSAFRYLKVMADHWFLDVVNHRNEFADRLLGNLQRYNHFTKGFKHN